LRRLFEPDHQVLHQEARGAFEARTGRQGWDLDDPLLIDRKFRARVASRNAAALSARPRSIGRPCRTLLAEVRSRKVDVVVVYKVDRLTRSLADFAKLIELFERSSTPAPPCSAGNSTLTSRSPARARALSLSSLNI
jgi:hypothetical protein